MNAYDFDGTLYDGDSSVDFTLWCLRRYPKSLRRIPAIMAAFVSYYVAHSISKTQMKQVFFSYVQDVPQLKREVELFWDEHLCKIGAWYLDRQQKDDVIISASPAFLLQEACKRLGIQQLIASDVDPTTGVFRHQNMRGTEKTRLFMQRFPGIEPQEFYSDSVEADAPMAALARHAYVVTHGVVTPWPQNPR